MRRLVSLIAVSLVSAAAIACVSGPGDSRGSEESTLSRTSECGKTICEAHFDDCQSYLDQCFGQCNAMGMEYASQCISVCYNYDCGSCTAEGCAEPAYQFTIESPRNEELFGACQRAVARDAYCGEEISGTVCELYSRLEKPENAAAYDCIAKAPCGAPTFACVPTPVGWGMDFCLALNGRCDAAGFGCTVEQVDSLNAWAAWVKDDVLDEAMRCLDEDSCTEIGACIEAWQGTVMY